MQRNFQRRKKWKAGHLITFINNFRRVWLSFSIREQNWELGAINETKNSRGEGRGDGYPVVVQDILASHFRPLYMYMWLDLTFTQSHWLFSYNKNNNNHYALLGTDEFFTYKERIPSNVFKSFLSSTEIPFPDKTL